MGFGPEMAIMNEEMGLMTDYDKGALFYDEILLEAANHWQLAPKDLEIFLDKIAYHESWHTMDPSKVQGSGSPFEPGRGLFQFEMSMGTNQGGGATGANRTAAHLAMLEKNGIVTVPTPEWILNSIDPMYGRTIDFDASQLDRRNQYILMISNLRQDPAASLKNVTTNEELMDFWINHHWKGSGTHTQTEIDNTKKQFMGSVNAFDKKYPNGYVWPR